MNCPVCGSEALEDAKFCSRCGFPLDESTKLQMIKQETDMARANDILDDLLNDREFREMFVKKLQSYQKLRKPGAG